MSSWDAWVRRGLNLFLSAAVIGGLTTLTTYQGEHDWAKAAVPGGVAALGAVVQHLRAQPQKPA